MKISITVRLLGFADSFATIFSAILASKLCCVHLSRANHACHKAQGVFDYESTVLILIVYACEYYPELVGELDPEIFAPSRKEK